jgi:protein TonB
VNSGDTPAVPLAIPTDRFIELPFIGRGPAEPISAVAMTLAALLHVAVPVLLLLHWPGVAPIVLPKPIPVALVTVPPPETPPAPPAMPKEPPPSPYLESGPGEHTTALAPADTVAPERASPPPEPDAPINAPATEPAETAAAGDAPSAKPSPLSAESSKVKPKPRKEIARLEPTPKEALKSQAPSLAPTPRHLNIQLGDKNESGDPYLNHLMELIEAHRVYPRITGQFGLLVEGVPVYALFLNRGGSIVRLGLVRSSGNAKLDEVGAVMIQQSSPLPPPPANIPEGVPIVLTLPLYPQS